MIHSYVPEKELAYGLNSGERVVVAKPKCSCGWEKTDRWLRDEEATSLHNQHVNFTVYGVGLNP